MDRSQDEAQEVDLEKPRTPGQVDEEEEAHTVVNPYHVHTEWCQGHTKGFDEEQGEEAQNKEGHKQAEVASSGAQKNNKKKVRLGAQDPNEKTKKVLAILSKFCVTCIIIFILLCITLVIYSLLNPTNTPPPSKCSDFSHSQTLCLSEEVRVKISRTCRCPQHCHCTYQTAHETIGRCVAAGEAPQGSQCEPEAQRGAGAGSARDFDPGADIIRSWP